MMMHCKRVLPAVILVVGLAACSERKPPAPPTEQQIHSSDSAVATGEMGRHRYRCSDGEPLFVDYKDNGLQIDLRRSNGGPPMMLTAPAQGLQYVGETATATFKGSQLTIVEGDHEVGTGPYSETGFLIPDRAIVLGVTGIVIEAVTGAASWKLGVADDPARYGNSLGVAEGSTVIGPSGTPCAYYGATPLRVTAQGGDFTGGKLRLAIHCLELVGPAA